MTDTRTRTTPDEQPHHRAAQAQSTTTGADRWPLPSSAENNTALRPPRAWPISLRGLAIMVIGLAVMVGIGSAVGAVLVDKFGSDPFFQAEADIATWLSDQRTETLDELTHIVSYPGDAVPKTVILWIIALGLVVFLKRLDLAVFLVATLELQRTAYGLISGWTTRNRPQVEQLDVSTLDASFPSGHVASTTVMAGALVLIFGSYRTSPTARRIAIALGSYWVIQMAIVRMYRGMHYLSDVIAGILLGLTALAIGVAALRIVNRDVNRRLQKAPSDHATTR